MWAQQTCQSIYSETIDFVPLYSVYDAGEKMTVRRDSGGAGFDSAGVFPLERVFAEMLDLSDDAVERVYAPVALLLGRSSQYREVGSGDLIGRLASMSDARRRSRISGRL